MNELSQRDSVLKYVDDIKCVVSFLFEYRVVHAFKNTSFWFVSQALEKLT